MLLDGRGAPAPRIQQRDARPDQLVEVLVARDDHGLETALGRCVGQRPDHVVGLVPVHAHDPHAECL
ncbi:MAG TPA: hypothetical protein VFI66_02475, partial [Gemmatimonadales bacterium]|nr:hypothetical protein [Gemmatimonadales bacterium]